MECIACAKVLSSSAVVVDERTSRNLIEDPVRVKNNLEFKIKKNVRIDKNNLAKFQKEVRGIKLIRSVELAVIAYEMGFLSDLAPEKAGGQAILLDAMLWGIKLNGCSLPRKEIEELMRLEAKRRK
jgi:hypothetical protein